MITEKVLSTILYEGKDAENAPFWKECFHEDELTSDMKLNGKQWFAYHVKFDGLKPVMITKIEKIKK